MNLIAEYRDVLLLSALIICMVLLIFVLTLMGSLSKLKKKMKAMLGSTGETNLEESIIKVQHMLADQQHQQARLQQQIEAIVQQLQGMKARSAMLRYNAFHETGSDLSFSIAIVDANGDGHVLTGIHSRHDTQIYAKPLERGESNYSLTPEEKEAISRALQG